MVAKDKFNIASEKEIQNRISGYNLTQNEKTQIWKYVENRDNSLQSEEQDFKKNFKNKYQEEFNRLLSDQQPHRERHLTPDGARTQNGLNRGVLMSRAQDNVQSRYNRDKIALHRSADKQINQVLDRAKQDGRGPQSELQQDFKRAHDHER